MKKNLSPRPVNREHTTPKGARQFVADPPQALPPSDWVHIETPEREINRASNAVIAFWLRLKSTPGCLSKRNPVDGTMHLYIEPNSEAAMLFVRRMIKKLPPGQAQALLPEHTDPIELPAAAMHADPNSVEVQAKGDRSFDVSFECAPACPACGSADLTRIRGKVHCARCHATLETCCD